MATLTTFWGLLGLCQERRIISTSENEIATESHIKFILSYQFSPLLFLFIFGHTAMATLTTLYGQHLGTIRTFFMHWVS